MSDLAAILSSPSRHEATDSDCVVIVGAVRSPFCRANKGALKDTHADDLLAAVLRQVCAIARLDPSAVDDIVVGCVLQPGGGATLGRVAALAAGFPPHVAVSGSNRQCASSLEAIAIVADKLARNNSGVCIGIGCGIETMSHTTMNIGAPIGVSDAAVTSDCAIPMGVTSDTVSRIFGISRDRCDEYAASSHHRASSSSSARRSVVPINGVTADDGVRPECTAAALAALRPAFTAGGSTTAGNSSQISDGAAAVLLARKSVASALRLPILGIWRSYAIIGLEPALMGIGPAQAIPRALRLAGLDLADVDVFEINEAFASQVIYCIEHLGIPRNKVNPWGGAIALGHPLGATGARLVCYALDYLAENKLRYAVVSLCVGTGMGAAAVLENPLFESTAFTSKL